MKNKQVISSPRLKKVFYAIAVVFVGLTLCTAMKPFVCGKAADGCPCQAASDQADRGCAALEED